MAEKSLNLPNFEINSKLIISNKFREMGVCNFTIAIHFIKQFPYGRNADKENLETVFIDGCGTCSTKHALLKQLAIENNFYKVKLYTGLFKMNGKNTPEIKATLEKYKLEFIPEVHCYLKFENETIDVTKANSSPEDFINDLIEEREIQANQITNYKVDYHKEYLKKWLKENKEIEFTLDEIWAIREQCIQDLATEQ